MTHRYGAGLMNREFCYNFVLMPDLMGTNSKNLGSKRPHIHHFPMACVSNHGNYFLHGKEKTVSPKRYTSFPQYWRAARAVHFWRNPFWSTIARKECVGSLFPPEEIQESNSILESNVSQSFKETEALVKEVRTGHLWNKHTKLGALAVRLFWARWFYFYHIYS